MKSLMRAAALSLLLCGTAVTASAQPPERAPMDASRPTTLNLGAYGEVRTAPDMATIMLGVMTQGPTAEAAMRANADRMASMMAALRRQGIAERDIQTAGINLNPQYVYEPNTPPRLTGYQANNQVTIRVMDLARLGQALDATVAAGANEVQGISFGLRTPATAEDEARRRAVAALQAKAGLYATALGGRVGRLVTLNEGGGYAAPPPRPVPMAAMARIAGESAQTSVSPGEIVVRIDISGVYELAR
jgi:uncharacterized protein